MYTDETSEKFELVDIDALFPDQLRFPGYANFSVYDKSKIQKRDNDMMFVLEPGIDLIILGSKVYSETFQKSLMKFQTASYIMQVNMYDDNDIDVKVSLRGVKCS